MVSTSPDPSPLTLLDLNTDILQLIVEHLPIEDARNFRTCARRAEQVASPHALSHQVLRLSSGSLLDMRIDRLVQWQRDRLSWIHQLVVKCYVPGTHRIDALVRVLSAAQGLRELTSNALEDNLELRLRDAIATLPCLAKLILEETGPNTSAWILNNGSLSSDFPCLTSLSLTLLDFRHWQPNPRIRRLATLRNLSINTLLGPPERLIQFAPRLTSLRFESFQKTAVLSPAARKAGWTTLTSIAGPVDGIHRLLPLIHTIVHTVGFTQAIRTEDEAQCIKPTLEALEPCCLEIGGDFKPALVFSQLTPSSQRLFYFQFDLPDDEDWVTQFAAIAKDFTSLICIKIDADHAKLQFDKIYTNELHYLTCRLPALRFLLTDPRGTPSPDKMKPPAFPAPLCLPTRGLVFSKAEVAMADWLNGRAVAVLTPTTAERVRRAYCEVAFEARLEVYEQLFPGSMISDCTNRGIIHGLFAGRKEFPFL